jgi:T5SS/PEP-CTERM-associated repeat protein
MNTRLGFVACLAMATAAMVNEASVTYGQITYTNAQANGNWAAPGTWSLGVPTDAQAAAINGGFTVTLDQAGATTNLLDVGTISSETGNLTIAGGNLYVTDTDTVTEPNIPSFRIGTANGATGNVTMTGGEVFIGDVAGSDIGNGELLIGDNGTGTATVSGGTLQAADEIFVGLFAGSDGNLNVSGGSVEAMGRSILVGFAGGTGALNVSETGSVRANFDMLIGMLEGSSAEITQSGGTVEAGFFFTNFAAGGAGSTVNWTMTGGTLTSRIALVLGQGGGSTTMNHSGGAINVPQGNGDMIIGESFDPDNTNVTTYNINGTATVNLLHNMIISSFDGSTGTVNQTGGTITAADNIIVGRAEVGNYNISAGQINTTGVYLGDFDTCIGTMKITGGDVNVSGTFNVGGALASNAAPDRVEPTSPTDAQGQALGAEGVLIVSGNAATIDVGGNFRANPDDKSPLRSDASHPGIGDNAATLAFEIFNSSGTSLINVAGIADLDGAVIDLDLMGGFTPSIGATFDLLKASSFGSTGLGTTENVGTGEAFTLAGEDTGAFSLAIVASGGFETLRATFLGGATPDDADFDGDGDVDGADFLTWQRGLGATGADLEDGDANGDSNVNAADLAIWNTQFGPAAVPAASNIPEPSAALLLGIGLTATVLRRRT